MGQLFYKQKISKHRQKNTNEFLLKIFKSLTESILVIKPMGLCDPWANTYLLTQLQTLLMRGTTLKPINVLIAIGATTKPAPSPRPSTNMRGKQIFMTGLNTPH